MFWSELTFGKYKGKTLPEIVLKDPGWFFWAVQEKKFDCHPGLLTEAEDLNFKARHIKIPRPDPRCWRICYLLTEQAEFVKFELIHSSAASTPDCLGTFWSDHLDLSLPRVTKYDKASNRRLIQCFKQYFFDNPLARLSLEKCAEFFSNPRNFLKLIHAASNAPVDVSSEITIDAWRAELEQARLLSIARERRRLEQRAKFSPRAARRLASEIELEIEEERSNRIMATWARKSRERVAEPEEDGIPDRIPKWWDLSTGRAQLIFERWAEEDELRGQRGAG
jgi:hypothetical protein